MRPAEILYVNPTAQMGGAEYSLLDLAASLDARRFSPLLACLGDGPLAEAAAARGLRVAVLPLAGRLARLSLKGRRSGPLGLGAAALAAVPTVRRLRELAARSAIVHTNGNKAHLLGVLACGRAPLVWHVRDFWRNRPLERGMARVANRRTHAVIANSEAVRAHLTHLGLSDTLVHAVHNGIDTARFGPAGPVAPLRQEFGLPADAPLVGIVGMLARWKGQDVLLKAFAQLLRRQPAARLVIAGDEIYVTRGQMGFGGELRALARELEIAHAVVFAGYRTDVPALLRALDVVVHASVEPEPFGRVVAEAMACGRPVVAAEAGGVPEVTGRDGALLVPPADPGVLAAAIERLLAAPDDAARLGAAGRERILSRFPLSVCVERVQAIYCRILESTAAGVVPGKPVVRSSP